MTIEMVKAADGTWAAKDPATVATGVTVNADGSVTIADNALLTASQ